MAETEKQHFENFKQLATLISYLVISIDIYYHCFNFFYQNDFTGDFVTQMLSGISKIGFFSHPINSKILILILTIFFVLFDKGRKNIDIDKKTIIFRGIAATII